MPTKTKRGALVLHKMTAARFVRVCLVFDDLAPGLVWEMFRPGARPGLPAVARAAAEFAARLPTDFNSYPTHARALEVAAWAKGQA